MYVDSPRQKNIFRIPRNFAQLKSIQSNGDLIFNLIYNINQSDIVKNETQICRVTVISRVIKSRNIIQDKSRAKVNNANVIKSIQSLTAAAKSAIKNQSNFHVATARIDNTKVINNEIAGAFRKNLSLSQISSLNTTKLKTITVRDAHRDNFVMPILQINAGTLEENLTLEPTRHIFQLGIAQRGIDPTHSYNLFDDMLTPHEATRGVTTKVWNQHVNFSDRADKMGEVFKQITRPPQQQSTVSSTEYSEDTKILAFVTEITDERQVSSMITMPSDKIKDVNGHFKEVFIQFDLLNSHGIIIQTQQEKLDILEHLQIHNTPKLPPEVKLAKFDTLTRGNIQVKQLDPTAIAVRIYRKNLSYSVNERSSYVLVNEFPLTATSGFVSIPVDVSARNATIYRVVPVGEFDAVATEFTNIVIKPKIAQRNMTFVSVSTKIVDTGINVEVREVPPGVVSFRVVRRDDTINETDFSIIGDASILINPHDDQALYLVTDTSVKKGHSYEYATDLIYRNGTINRAGCAIVEYQPLISHLVETTIDDFVVNFDISNLDVKFRINTIVNETNIDVIRSMLQRQGIEEHFINDLTKERAKFQELIAHIVHRVNLTTGARENFGVITNEYFSDKALRKINAVSDLKVGTKYRYEVVACLRSAETLFEDFVKPAIDANTSKTYVYKPNKFLHPVTLTHGNICEPRTLAVHYPYDPMAFGAVGNLEEIDVSFSQDLTYVVEASVEEFDRSNLLVKWSVNGPSENIDHFIIMKQHLGQRHIVGKAHPNFERQTLVHVYPRTNYDIGQLFFVITPVFNTYGTGIEVKTNGIEL